MQPKERSVHAIPRQDIGPVRTCVPRAQSFFDEGKGHTYNPAEYPDHGTGFFFLGLEANGMIYVYAPDHSGAEGVGVDAQGNVYGAVVRRQMLERHIRKP